MNARSTGTGFFLERKRGQASTALLIINNLMSSLLCACKRLAIFGWLLAVPVLVSGQSAFSPGGNNYAIAGALAGDQSSPQSAINSAGGYLVWQDNSASTNGLRIKAVRLNPDLTASGVPFVVSANAGSKITFDQEKPQVALLQGGGAVIVWQGGKYGFQKIYARFLSPNGTLLARDLLVNTYRPGFQINPAVAVLTDGSIIVVWASDGQDGDLQGIFGQRLSAAGAKLGREFRLNQWTAKNQRTPAVAALANGSFVAVWVSELQRAPASVDIYTRIFNSSGVAAGDEFPVNPDPTNICANPSLAASPQSGFMVAWSQKDVAALAVEGEIAGLPSTSRSTNGWDVVGSLFDVNGASVTSPVRLNTYVYGDQYAPKVSACDNRYMTVWTSLGQDGSREGVFGQFLTGSGAFEGPEFPVNTTTISRQIQPAVAADGVNRFLVVWSSFVANTSFDLYARTYLETVGP